MRQLAALDRQRSLQAQRLLRLVLVQRHQHQIAANRRFHQAVIGTLCDLERLLQMRLRGSEMTQLTLCQP